MTFLITAAVVCLILLGNLISLHHSKNPDRFYFILPIALAFFTVPIYSIFLLSKNYFPAIFFEGLYFVCTDWLCFSMMLFSLAYTEQKKNIKYFIIVFFVLCFVDSTSLIVNSWTKHSFEIIKLISDTGIRYWGNRFTFIHYMHLSLCYVMTLIALSQFVYNAVEAPWSYKKKYAGIFCAFVVVIFSNIICYSQNLIVDFSVLLYPLLSIFIYYFSFYSVPQTILTKSLVSINESINDAILYFDINDDCIFKNSTAKKIFSGSSEIEFLLKARNSISRKPDQEKTEFFMIDGKERQYEIEYEDIYYDYNLIGSYLKLTDKTDEISRFLKQRFLATHDSLTGVYNRDYFFEAANKMLKEDPDTPRLMLCTNIRQFKLVNELFGEETGDRILIEIAHTGREVCIHGAVMGRISDDRFACMAKKEFFSEELIEIFQKNAQKALGDSVYKVDLRVGICEIHGDSESAQILYDKAQLVINNMGNDYFKTYGYYDSDFMDQLLRERQIAAEFEDALSHGQIEMYLQPYVDKKGTVFGAQSLARWNHPERGMLLPGLFIPALERAGLVHKLDLFIWESAARKLHNWRLRGITGMQISVNVSPKDIYHIDIVDEFKQLLLRYSFEPKNLKIEFTEETLTNVVNNASELFEKLKKLGFEVGIDDFGNGYSSLNMLKDINADILKMDLALVQQTANSERSKVILDFISQISKTLRMQLISEGVETAEQLNLLKELGFPYFQGYYFSKPLAVNDFENKYLG